MGLDIYFREDLAHILASAEVASQATAWAAGMEGDLGKLSRAERLRAYREGYRAALMVVAQALGLTEGSGPFIHTEDPWTGRNLPPERGEER